MDLGQEGLLGLPLEMNQLALAIQLNHQTNLHNFCWGNNTLLQQQLHKTLSLQGERILYIWGNSGCGKSHLLQGCCQQGNLSSVYLPLELLKDAGPESIDGMTEQQLIAIDNIEAIAGIAAWEEALFYLYNRVRDSESTMLIISGNKPPATLPIALADLRSRLAWGLVMHLEELSDELKITTMQQQASKRGFLLPESVALFLIKRCARNMHDLQKMLDQLDNASLAAQRKITIPFVKAILQL